MAKNKIASKLFSLVLVVIMLATAVYIPIISSAEVNDPNATTVNYEDIADASKLSIDYYSSKLSMFDGAGLNVKNGLIVADADWSWQLNVIDTDITEKTGGFAVYKIAAGTPFTATFSADTDLSAVKVLVSEDAVAWETATPETDTQNFKITVENAESTFSYVKIVWPVDTAVKVALASVTFTKPEQENGYLSFNYGVSKPAQNSSVGIGLNDVNVLNKRGVWQSGGLDYVTGGVFVPNYNALNNATSANSYNGYVTYKVEPNNRFSLNVTSNRSTSTVATRLGFDNPLDWGIEIYGSADNENFERINVTPVYSARYANNQNGGDARRSADYTFIVPDGMVFIKCKLPITQNLSTLKGKNNTAVWPYIGNDLFEINKVEFTRFKYDYHKMANNDYYITTAFSNDTKQEFGISSYGGKLNRTGAGVFDTDWTYQYQNGLADTHAVYEIEPGTAFYSEFTVIYPPNLAGYYAKKDFVIKLLGWNFTEGEWQEAGNLTLNASTYDSTRKYYYVSIAPEDNVYNKIKILWPSKVDNTYVGDDCAGLTGVSFTAPQPDTRTVYNYTDLTALPIDDEKYLGQNLDSIVSPPLLGISSMAPNTVTPSVCSLHRSNKTGATDNGKLSPNRTMIVRAAPGTIEFYADYEVQPLSRFTVTVTVNNNASWGKPVWESMEVNAGKKFEFKLLTSPDGVNWTLAKSTGDKYGQLEVDIIVPADANFVRVLFPQNGNPNGAGKDGKNPETNSDYRVFNDMATLDGVKLVPGENSSYDKYFNYNTIGENNLSYVDSNYESLMFYDFKGVNISKYENGKAYLGVNEEYVAEDASASPYVTYFAKPNAKTKIAISRNAANCALMGEDWNIKIYESADNAQWKEITAAPETVDGFELGVIETYRFDTSADTKYIKIEFPYSDKEGSAKYIGVSGIGFSPNEYGEYVYSDNYTFANELEYANEEKYPNKEMLKSANIMFYDVFFAGITQTYFVPKTGIVPNWDYLAYRTELTKPNVVYNVVPGTAFKAVFTYNTTAVDTIEKAIASEFMPKLYISSDYVNYTEYCTDKVRMAVSDSNPSRGSVTLTIDNIPEGTNFVRVEFPHTGDMSVITDKAFAYAGNDIMEIAYIGFTKGTMTEEDLEDILPPEDEEDKEIYIFLPPDMSFSDSDLFGGSGSIFDSNDGFDFGFEDSFDFDLNGDLDGEEIQANNGKRKVKKVVKRQITVIDGYYYPLWVWILWIGGGVVALAGITLLVILLIKKKKKSAI